MALIGKGIWKTDYDKKGLQSNALAGAILIIIGVSVLVGTFVPVNVWARIGLSNWNRSSSDWKRFYSKKTIKKSSDPSKFRTEVRQWIPSLTL